MSGELHYLTITEASRRIRAGELSPVELCEAYLSRIDEVGPALRAFITVLPEQALAMAREAERDISKHGPRGPLHGVPYALKDIYDTAGVLTTGHSAITQHRVPEHDSRCAARLSRAGGVLIGKLATHEFATGGPSYDIPWPPACNPWRLDRFPGGSSSGAGAAVAAGLVPGALGSDTGGSIRLPAAYCGLVGLKPTYGRVSKRGVMPLSWTLDNCGPLTWTVQDAAIMLQAIAGYDSLDPGSAAVDVPDFSAEIGADLRGTRIGVVRHFYERDVEATPETVTAMDAAYDVFTQLGAELVNIELPPLETYQACYRTIVMSEAYALHEQTLRTRASEYGASFRYRILSGALIDASDYVSALRMQRSLMQTTLDALSGVDVLVTATIAGPAPVQHLMTSQGGFRSPPLSNPFNIAQCPAVSICNGFSADGLPLALQIVARPFEEAHMLRFAAAYEAATQWREHRPQLLAAGGEETVPESQFVAGQRDGVYAALAQRIGLNLDQTQLDELVAVMPTTDALVQSVRAQGLPYGKEPGPTFHLAQPQEVGR
jgi:aspartyl-tRNA(Asn)/glutamyl-tRNA(Gln) amidotransferase subunit A